MKTKIKHYKIKSKAAGCELTLAELCKSLGVKKTQTLINRCQTGWREPDFKELLNVLRCTEGDLI